jgi:hypothetical protein
MGCILSDLLCSVHFIHHKMCDTLNVCNYTTSYLKYYTPLSEAISKACKYLHITSGTPIALSILELILTGRCTMKTIAQNPNLSHNLVIAIVMVASYLTYKNLFSSILDW